MRKRASDFSEAFVNFQDLKERILASVMHRAGLKVGGFDWKLKFEWFRDVRSRNASWRSHFSCPLAQLLRSKYLPDCGNRKILMNYFAIPLPVLVKN